MITLYLVGKGILKKPILYLSDFFERNKNLYYNNLTLVREENNLAQWMKFFLVGVIETSQKSIETLDAIMKLRDETEDLLQTLGSRYNNAQLIINQLYKSPIINIEKAQEVTGLSLPTIYKLMDDLKKLAIVDEISGKHRGKLFSFAKYLNLFN